MSDQEATEKPVKKKASVKKSEPKAEKKELDFEKVEKIGKKLNLSEHKIKILFNDLKELI